MAHHSSDRPLSGKPEDISENLKKLLDTATFRGALGTFPEGMLTPHDEGAIQFAISVVKGKVVVDYGTPVRSLGCTPQQAVEFAESLIRFARQAARENGAPLTVRI